MQRKLEELAAGVCASQSSILQFSPEKLEFEVLEGSVYTGEFSIRSTDQSQVGMPGNRISGDRCDTAV